MDSEKIMLLTELSKVELAGDLIRETDGDDVLKSSASEISNPSSK
jgi:hypothetical protein